MLTVLAFVVAIGLLIAIHEYGHYRVAVACGVRVLRFSVGFGREIWRFRPRRQHPGQDTEFVIAMVPLGGYVRMLDEREAPVDPAERHRAFNTQPLKVRAAIVAAGPAANLLLAVALYALVAWMGVSQPRALIATPVAGSPAQAAGLRSGDEVLRAAPVGEELADLRSFEALQWTLTQAALRQQDVELEVRRSASGEPGGEGPTQRVTVVLSGLDVREADASLIRRIGLLGPWTRAVVGPVATGGAAEAAGLKEGDWVRTFDGRPVADGQQLREWIRASVRDGAAVGAQWQVVRDGQTVSLTVLPRLTESPDGPVPRIEAFIGAQPERVEVRYGPLDGLLHGLERTWDVSVLSLSMMGKMLIGEASLKNLSGPLTIADYAGKSASLGLTQYLVFLALISVSLGVLNLLPLPVLDGGHLMYYAWEGITGRPVSEVWLERLQRGGVAVLIAMMSVALFNDVARLVG